MDAPAFGFLGGQEIADAHAGNIGLRDRESSGSLASILNHVNDPVYAERFAMEWVQKYIHEFGGDPTRVTM